VESRSKQASIEQKLPQALFKDPSALDILAVLAVERLKPIPNYDATLKEHAKNNAVRSPDTLRYLMACHNTLLSDTSGSR